MNLDINDLCEEQNNDFSYIDILVQQRNNKKSWTIVSNLRQNKDKINDFIQKAKKKLSTNAAVDENNNIRFNGSHKEEVMELLMKEFTLKKEQIRVH